MRSGIHGRDRVLAARRTAHTCCGLASCSISLCLRYPFGTTGRTSATNCFAFSRSASPTQHQQQIKMSKFNRNLAITIGINNYTDGISTLSTAVNDSVIFLQLSRRKPSRKRAKSTNLYWSNKYFEQAVRLKLKKGTRVSPHLEKCCLLLVANESFTNAEQDIEILTGLKISHSTQHRLVNSYQLRKPKITKKAN